ncbi:MAG: leucyl/phenylalanyl-tRNA--protein transferase [Rhodobacteraceae bacterium]|nr:leucyl/phenylalanyl-tRNA--protein transferase [Paracoccaceae bacterium]
MKDADNRLDAALLLRGYASGIFPMAEARDDPRVFWVDPRRRGIMPLDGFRISRSLRRRLRRQDYQIALNQDFAGVVTACADRDETWINSTIFDLYLQLHAAGTAHSLEVRQDGALVGGVYGVTLGAVFFGESMFSRITNASKIALAFLVDHLRQTGFALFDTQFLTQHLASLGGIEIPRSAYHARLRRALQQTADFTSLPPAANAQEVLQRSTQTS